MTCQTCGSGWPAVKVDTYWGPEGPKAFCDDCLFDGFQTEESAVVTGSAWYVAADGTESELPSYAN